MKFIDVSTGPRRIVGIAADVDDENVVPGATLTVYHPLDQEIGGGRLFVHTHSRSLRAGHSDHAHHPRSVGRSAGRKRRHARRRPRRSADSRSSERAGLRRLRGSSSGDRGDWRGRRAGIFSQRPHARVRHPPGARRATAQSSHQRNRPRCADGRESASSQAPHSATSWRASPTVTSWTCACPTQSQW